VSGLSVQEILQSIAGVSCFMLIVVGLVVGVIFLVRRSRGGANATGNTAKPEIAMPEATSQQAAKPPAASQLVCGKCGAANPPENNFCEQCGGALAK
jgi:ribosomal protein L40E